MKVVGCDSETFPIKPGLLAPETVCWSWAERARPGAAPVTLLEDAEDGLETLRGHLMSRDTRLVIHNAPFDLGCAAAEDSSLLPLIFDAYADGRIWCTISAQKVIDVALGMRKFRRVKRSDGSMWVTKSSYMLSDLVKLYTGRHLEKVDTWRVKYGLLAETPIEEWPEDARAYAIGDAVEHLTLYDNQQVEITDTLEGDCPNIPETCQAAWALHLMAMWGVRAEPERVQQFVETCQEQIGKMRAYLVCETCNGQRTIGGPLKKGGTLCPECKGVGSGTGLARACDECDSTGRVGEEDCAACNGEGATRSEAIFKPDGSRTMRVIQERVRASLEKLGIPVPLTEKKEEPQTSKEVLEMTDDLALHALAETMGYEKQLGQWGPVVTAATQRPVCARYNELVETGRTSCSGSEGQEGTNFQNPPRKGDVRPCFTPRRGWVYVSTDADTIELRAHAQNLLEIVGWSRMAEALVDQHANKGPDLHLRLAANLLGIDPYEALARFDDGDPEVDDARQFSKVPGFGFPGGLGPPTLVAYAAGMLSKKQHQKWFGTNPTDQLRSARRVRDVWFETWPENRPYFAHCSALVGGGRRGRMRQLMSNRIRDDATYTAICNGYFQGRVADGMKEALFILAFECYTGRCWPCQGRGRLDAFADCETCGKTGRSVLHGSRPVMFLHDEPIVEHPDNDTLTARAHRQRDIVVAALTRWMPDIPCTSTAVAMRRWFKGSKPIYIDKKLVPVKPIKIRTGILDAEGEEIIKTKWVEDPRPMLVAA